MTVDQLRAAFRKDGYVVLSEAVERDRIAMFLQQVTRAMETDPWLDLAVPPGAGDDVASLMKRRAARLDDVIPDRRRILFSDKIHRALSSLMDDEPFLVSQGLPLKYSLFRQLRDSSSEPARNAHVHHYSHVEPAKACVMTWLALEDIAPESGPMWVCPGSHKDNETLFDRVLAADPSLQQDLALLRAEGGEYGRWTRWFSKMQARMTDILEDEIAADRRVPILVRAGDMVLFDPALSHGTREPDDPLRTRWSLIAKFQGKHAIERSWATWFGNSIYLPALRTVPPAKFETVEAGDAEWPYAVDPSRDHIKMFWTHPLMVEV